ncbi:MAG: NADH-quinone oxidoreductase subunit H [Candidatus Riflebacteria bacterium]|nr:NADH-quinone oxidoreductase subunit H [Candidatus Riflebacteria bacterium]
MVEINFFGLINIVFALIFSPLLIGIINRIKAFFAGRQGQPVLQPYIDIRKLLYKGAVYSRTVGSIFVAGPIIALASMLALLFLSPFGGIKAFLVFPGDLLVFAYLFGLARFFTVLAALDTGSAFEGMGASREVTYSALSELSLFVGLLALTMMTGTYSLSQIYSSLKTEHWLSSSASLILVVAAFYVIFLSENARIPVDDPNTHLELTMIHEVMVLDHCGVDFAFIQYGAALKMWLLGGLIVGLLSPSGESPFYTFSAGLCGIVLLAVITGIVESVMARLRLIRIPQLLVGALVLASLAVIIGVR